MGYEEIIEEIKERIYESTGVPEFSNANTVLSSTYTCQLEAKVFEQQRTIEKLEQQIKRMNFREVN